jgi:hypothetical protein
MKKRYYNETTKEWYTEGQSMTRRIENGVFAGVPTEEQLTEWGFEEYVAPTPPAPTPEQLLERAKDSKIGEVEMYDQSSNVNEFTVTHDGQIVTTHWFEPNIRANYKNSVESAELVGQPTVSFYVGDMPLTLPTQNAKLMLAQIQLYADACYIVTQQHKAAIEALETIEAVDAYDYTQSYPTKLSFAV